MPLHRREGPPSTAPQPRRLRRYLVFGVLNLVLAAGELANTLTAEPRHTGGLLLAAAWLFVAGCWFWQWRRSDPSDND